MSTWVNILIVMALSTTKYMAGVAVAIVNLGKGWGPLTFFLATVGGGMIGVVAYDLLLMEILYFIKKKRGIDPTKFRVNKRMRRLVRFRNKFGLTGIALLTPIILQVPVGTILAGTIEQNSKKVFLYMFLSFTLYSSVFYALYHFLGINPNDILRAVQFWK
ncbi:hypothetical protein GC194_12915 [bacterium]|nr:hypothetical protein [bacterium]